MKTELKERYLIVSPGCGEIFWAARTVTPTGRWKVINVNGESDLLVEVKKMLFGTRWITSGSLDVEYREEYINECGGSHEKD